MNDIWITIGACALITISVAGPFLTWCFWYMESMDIHDKTTHHKE